MSRSQKLLVALGVIVVGAIVLVYVQPDRGVSFVYDLLYSPTKSPTTSPHPHSTAPHITTVTTSSPSDTQSLTSPTPPTRKKPSVIVTANVTMSLVNSDGTPIIVRPERVIPAADVSNVYVSILTVPKLHGSRLSYQLMTWIQSFNPQQIRIVTDASEDKWITAAKQMGLNVVFSGCASTNMWHQRNNLCCKTGRQYEEYFKAKKNGERYAWYCHVDDDIYLNAEMLAKVLSKYNDPYTQHVYLGQWNILQKTIYHSPRIKERINFASLEKFPEAKKRGVKYAHGSTFCVSDAVMNSEAEKYLSGKNFEDTCDKLSIVMDDVASGAVFEAILGNDLTDTVQFESHLQQNRVPTMNNEKLKALASLPMTLPNIRNARFQRTRDPSRFLSYHCLVYPKVSWCR